MSRVPGFHYITNYNYNNISEFFAKYDKEEKKTDFLNNYLIYCFVYKKFNYIKYIITHFNLDTINTRLTFNHKFHKFNLSLLCFSIFCDNIKFVKYLLKQNGKEYVINQDYCDYYDKQAKFKFDKGTPLFVAANYTKNYDIIDLLIEYGANVNAKDSRDLTPIMNVLLWNHKTDKEYIEYYQFLISRGANINLQNKEGNTALNYVIRQNKFNVALQLIDQCGANPFLLNNRKRDGIMEFIICLNLCDDYNGQSFWNIKTRYIENLLTITNVNSDLIYELFAASSTRINNTFLKGEYFDKVKNSTILNNDYNSIYWRERFNAIVGNDDDGDYFIHSVKILNRILHVYDVDTVISIIVYEILPCYGYHYSRYFEFRYDKFIKLIIYVIDVISNNFKSFKKLYGDASNIYEIVFRKFLQFVFRNFQNLLLENILETYRHMMYKFMKHKYFLENEEEYNCQLVEVIHIYIYELYEKCFYDATKRKRIEIYIKDEYPINLLDNNNNCILHNFFQDSFIFDKEDYVDEIIINFLFFIITHNDFKHLNLRNNENLTPLQLAMLQRRNKDIIQVLLDYGGVILDLDYLHPKYNSLNISQRFSTLQNLAAAKVKEQQRHYLPKRLQNFVVH